MTLSSYLDLSMEHDVIAFQVKKLLRQFRVNPVTSMAQIKEFSTVLLYHLTAFSLFACLELWD